MLGSFFTPETFLLRGVIIVSESTIPNGLGLVATKILRESYRGVA